MRLEFTKMHGLGNDFIVLELPADAPLPDRSQWLELSDRRTGIGFDQALVLQPARRADTDTLYRIFNADGSEVEQCGNGARCVAALLARRLGRTELTLDSAGGLLRARVLDPATVAINLGVPNFDPQSLPLLAPPALSRGEGRYALQLQLPQQPAGSGAMEFGAVSMGNPHAVLDVADVATAPVEAIGTALQRHPAFPRQVNVGFGRILDRGHMALRVFERGVGETRACGTGACAAVAVARVRGLVDSAVEVQLPGGVLRVDWQGSGSPIWLTGPAHTSYVGVVEVGAAEA